MRIDPCGRIGHADVKVGRVTVMLRDGFPEACIFRPAADSGAGTSLFCRQQMRPTAASNAGFLASRREQ